MKIFISWSGRASKALAEALSIWLPSVIQQVQPFYSQRIEKGTEGLRAIAESLESTGFGIICLTSENLKSPWIHFEAGALSKLSDKRLWTILLNLQSSDVEPPLGQFQHTLPTKDEMRDLLVSINQHVESPLSQDLLLSSFERCWPEMEKEFDKASKLITVKSPEPGEIRSDREIINEVLDILRSEPWKNSRPPLGITERATTDLAFVTPEPIDIQLVDRLMEEANEAGIVKQYMATPIEGPNPLSRMGKYVIRITLADIDRFGEFIYFQNRLEKCGVIPRPSISSLNRVKP